MSELNPINGGKKSRVLEEKRKREELERKRQRQAGLIPDPNNPVDPGTTVPTDPAAGIYSLEDLGEQIRKILQ